MKVLICFQTQKSQYTRMCEILVAAKSGVGRGRVFVQPHSQCVLEAVESWVPHVLMSSYTYLKCLAPGPTSTQLTLQILTKASHMPGTELGYYWDLALKGRLSFLPCGDLPLSQDEDQRRGSMKAPERSWVRNLSHWGGADRPHGGRFYQKVPRNSRPHFITHLPSF